ncbi:hypothetical protein ACOME3_005154 [Neoechinorhynchus agilis]
MNDREATDNIPPPEVRDRVYHALYFRLAIQYVRLFPSSLRRLHEFTLLAAAVFTAFLLVHAQSTLKTTGSQCLLNTSLPQPPLENTIIRMVLVKDRPPRSEPYWEQPASTSLILMQTERHSVNTRLKRQRRFFDSPVRLIRCLFRKCYQFATSFAQPEQYEVEFSLDYGLLHLSDHLRHQLKIPVLIVEKSPNDVSCFGRRINRMFQDHFLGQKDHMLAAFQFCYERYGGDSDGRAYVKVRTTGEIFHFAPDKIPSLWYPMSYIIMVIFTISISVLIRFTHYQIFILIVDLIAYTNDFTPLITASITPIGTAILALIGVESILTEFFKDSSSAFYIVILVWIADHFYQVCCRTEMSKKYWMNFFYLYQYIFYVNQIKSNGFFCELAFLCTLLFVMHSMLFALNHYELPALLRR